MKRPVIIWPRRRCTAIEMQIGRFYVRWCYLRGGLWARWHPFQPSRWFFGWDRDEPE